MLIVKGDYVRTQNVSVLVLPWAVVCAVVFVLFCFSLKPSVVDSKKSSVKVGKRN